MQVPSDLIGCQVVRTSFDYQVRLLLAALGSDGSYRVKAELEIEAPFALRDSTGEWHEIDPQDPVGARLAPVIDLFETRVSSLEVGTTGSLRLTFDSGAELRINPHPLYESWHLTGRGIAPITIGPGGETGWEMKR